MSRLGVSLSCLLAAAFVVVVAGPASAQKPAANASSSKAIVGTWTGPTQVPDQGTDQITLTITKTDSGIAGKIADSLNVIAGATDIKDLAFADDQLTGSFPLGNGQIIMLKLTLQKETLKGNWTHEGGDTGEIALERKKN